MATSSESVTLKGVNADGSATFVPTKNLHTSLPADVSYTCIPLNGEEQEIFKRVLSMKHTAKIKDSGEVTVRFELETDDYEVLKGEDHISFLLKPKKEDKSLFAKASVVSIKANGRMTCQIAFACHKTVKRSLNPEVSDR